MAFVWPSPGERPKKVDGVTFYALAGEDVAIDAHSSALLRAGQLKAYNPFGVSRPTFFDPGGTTATADLSFTVGLKHGASATTSGEVVVGDGDSSSWVWLADSVLTADGVDVLGYLDVGRWVRQSATGTSGSTTGMLYADLAARPIVLADDQLVFYCTGRLANNDGGEGQFYADFGSVVTADGATVISATGGRYIRIRSGAIYNPAWFGAVPGGAAATNVTALGAAIDKARGGAKLAGGYEQTPTDTNAIVHVSGDTLSGLTLENMWLRKTTSQLASSDPGAVLSLGQSPIALTNLTLRNMRISGNGQYVDIVKGLQLGFARWTRLENCTVENQVMEGFYWPGPASCRHTWLTNCWATKTGKAQPPGSALSAYNVNSSWSILQGLQAYDVGFFIEHTGHQVVVANCIFEKSSYGKPGIMLQSTTYHNRGAILANCIVKDTDLAAGIADNQRSHGLVYMANLVLSECRSGLQVGSKPGSNQPCVIDGVLAIDASSRGGLVDDVGRTGQAADAVVQINTGGHILEHVKCARPEGTTTGEIQSGLLTRMLCPTTTSTMHTMSIGSTFEIVGEAGTKTVTSTQATATYDYAPHDQIDFTPAAAGAVAAGAAVTFRPCPWLYLARCQTNAVNDYFTLQRWTVLDRCFSSVALYCHGWRWTMKDFTFQGRGANWSGLDLVRAVDVGGSFNAPNTLSCTQIDVTRRFCLSYTERSEFTSTGVPNTGTWKVGDICWYTAPAAGGYMGEVCITAGSNGTLPGAVTGTTTIGSPNIAISGGIPLGICVDNWITVAGEFGGAAVRVLPGSTSSVLIVSANASVGVAGAAVALSPSVWKTFGAVTP